MVKKFMLVATLCMCAPVSWGMEKEDAGTAPAVQQDALEKLGIPNTPGFKFFIEFKGEKIKISRQAFMRCKHFLDAVEAINNENQQEIIKTNELAFPWRQEILHLATDHTITKEDLERFVKVLQTPPNFHFQEYNSDINLNTLYIMLALADFANADLRELRYKLAARIEEQATDANYDQFLHGTGFLWDLIQNIPATLLATEEFRYLLCDGQLLKNRGPSNSVIQLTDDRLASGSKDILTRNKTSNTRPMNNPPQKHTDMVSHFIQLADGRLASGSRDGSIIIWTWDQGTNTWTMSNTLKGHTNMVDHLIQLADGRLASGSRDGSIIIWTRDQGTNTWTMSNTLKGHTRGVSSLIQLADERLASASWDDSIRIWSWNPTTTTWESSNPLQKDLDSVYHLMQLSDGRLASASLDDTIIIWDLNLSLDQHILVNALRRFKLAPQSLWAKTKNIVFASKEQPLTFATIFSNETLLDIFASLPDTAIQSLIRIHGTGIVQTAVEQLFKNMEDYLKHPEHLTQEITIARIGANIQLLTKFLNQQEKTIYKTRAEKLLTEINKTQTIVREPQLIQQIDNLLTALDQFFQKQFEAIKNASSQNRPALITALTQAIAQQTEKIQKLIEQISDSKVQQEKQKKLADKIKAVQENIKNIGVLSEID